VSGVLLLMLVAATGIALRRRAAGESTNPVQYQDGPWLV
jgi:hypothetical protein